MCFGHGYQSAARTRRAQSGRFTPAGQLSSSSIDWAGQHAQRRLAQSIVAGTEGDWGIPVEASTFRVKGHRILWGAQLFGPRC